MHMQKALRLTAEEERSMVLKVREALARRRMTREQLAEQAQVSISTLEKVLSGRRSFTLQTMVRVEEALGVKLLNAGFLDARELPVCEPPGAARPPREHAPDHLGNYARAAVAWLEGAYLTLRPSFQEAHAIFAYRTDIFWSDEASQLEFREAERLDHDYTQFGAVSVPHQSGHIYFVTNRHGQMRLAVVGRPTIRGDMHGLLTTLKADRGAHLSPVSLPIVYRRLKPDDPCEYGVISEGNAAFGTYRALLQKTLDDGFATLRLPG